MVIVDAFHDKPLRYTLLLSIPQKADSNNRLLYRFYQDGKVEGFNDDLWPLGGIYR